MNTIWKRLTSESPRFFKNIQAVGIILGAIGGVIVTLPEVMPSIILPEFIVKVAGYFVVAGLVSAAIAKTTVADASVLEKKNEAK